ncbi:hypothetical protein ACJKIH_12430 [Brucella pseudogrignonensis]|uniref:hypothetical protein n=1 Tax=Brucella pseudogrignonensis TaxID=419475 RepID=UPI0038B41DBF
MDLRIIAGSFGFHGNLDMQLTVLIRQNFGRWKKGFGVFVMKDPKFKHHTEAFVTTTSPEEFSRVFCEKYHAYIVLVEFADRDTIIKFDDGRAILSPTVNGFRLRVEASDLATCHGIRFLLLAEIDLCKTGTKG